jgi:hypothetical protein
MTAMMLIAGIGCLLAGLVAIGFGIPVKEFSFGNTLILAGAVAACTGLVMFGLWSVVRELRSIANRLGPALPVADDETVMLPAVMPAPQRQPPAEISGFPFGRDQRAEQASAEDAHPMPSSQDETPAAAEPSEAASVPKPRRNLMFSSTSRRERERAHARAADPYAHAPTHDPAPSEPAAVTFPDVPPKPERAKSAEPAAGRRAGRAPSTFDETSAGAVGNGEHPPVTVLKSGVVDGMAYSLYSDGSIEAQMPEGMMRFASIDELRAHLDQRP